MGRVQLLIDNDTSECIHQFLLQRKTKRKYNALIPISLLAFAEAGYKTVHLPFPEFGSSDANILPVAENCIEANFLSSKNEHS